MEKKEKNVISVPKFHQVFDNLEPKYKLDQEKKVLVQVGFTDIQAKIDANADCALNKILDRYLELGVEVPTYNVITNNDVDVIEDNIDKSDKLEGHLNYNIFVDDLRSKYNLGDLSNDDVLKIVNAKFKELSNVVALKNESNKEVKNDEKIQVEETKQ